MSVAGRLPYPSVEVMIEPAELWRLLGREVGNVALAPVDGAETSTDARFLAVSLDDEPTPSLFIKLVEPAKDWVALSADDRSRRAITMRAQEVFSRMPREVDPAVIACAFWENGCAILMPAISAYWRSPGPG